MDSTPSTASHVPSKSTRRYQHFCPAARALETIGERWSLLIVRDLLGGPRRFSELRRSLTAITPKWLSARLRALEADAIVTRDVIGEREVRYRLTPKGRSARAGVRRVARMGHVLCAGPATSRRGDPSRPRDRRGRALPQSPPRTCRTPRRVGHPLRGGSQLHHSIRWHSMVATARCGIGRRHRADLAAGVGEVSERGRRGPTSLVARAARQRNAGASRRAADLIRSSTADVALTRTWKPAIGHGQELRMRCFNPTS
jgi:DNA-binding HxlR family transcriptional regulator